MGTVKLGVYGAYVHAVFALYVHSVGSNGSEWLNCVRRSVCDMHKRGISQFDRRNSSCDQRCTVHEALVEFCWGNRNHEYVSVVFGFDSALIRHLHTKFVTLVPR